MATNLNLDDDLIATAVRLGRHASKRDAVDAALRAYIDQLARVASLASFGTFDFDPAYDPAKDRRDQR